jgi:hypothetical protein
MATPKAKTETVETEPDYHIDGDGKYDKCNWAEDHALRHPGHSVTVIQDYNVGDNGEAVNILRVTCNGTVDAFINGERNCDWWNEVILP